MYEVGTKLIRTQTGQHYVIEKVELEKIKGKLFRKEVLYHLKHERGTIDLIVHEDELKNLFRCVKQTNADKIHAMSIEELAKLLNKVDYGGLATLDYYPCDECTEKTKCGDCFKEWLGSEVEVGAWEK